MDTGMDLSEVQACEQKETSTLEKETSTLEQEDTSIKPSVCELPESNTSLKRTLLPTPETNEIEPPSKLLKVVEDINQEEKTMCEFKPPSLHEPTDAGNFPMKRSATSVTDDGGHCSFKKLKTSSDLKEKRQEEEDRHVRRRYKFLLDAVLNQMEFYFGDSSLSKDRYLKKMIDDSPDGYVDLALFGNFNKLQSLHQDGVSHKILVKALEGSKLLELSENQMKVRRVTPFREISEEETNSRTVYVENLPMHATHSWIRAVFSQCGKVVYVSLPIYRTTKQIKRFGFIEFETADDAVRACAMLNNPPPDEKPGKFPRTNKTLLKLQSALPSKNDQDSNEENISNKLEEDKSKEEDVKDEAGSSNQLGQSKRKKKKKSRKRKLTDSGAEDISVSTEGKADTAEGKKRKKKKKRKRTVSQEGDVLQDKQVKTELPQGTSPAETVQASQVDAANAKPHQVAQIALEAVKTANEGGRNKKRKRRRHRRGMKRRGAKTVNNDKQEQKQEQKKEGADMTAMGVNASTATAVLVDSNGVKLSRMVRKRLRQADIRRKKAEREAKMRESEMEQGGVSESSGNLVGDSAEEKKDQIQSDSAMSLEVTDCENEEAAKARRISDGSELTSCLKSAKLGVQKKVVFNPVPITTEFVKGKDIRKRRKPKKNKLHLRVITKKEWLSLREEYIAQQKSHMAALKESLRDLKQQEDQNLTEPKVYGTKHVDLENVFGTKRLKPSYEVKMAHVEALKFTPNVIVQWKCSHEMHRDKIRTMFKNVGGDSIAYIDAAEEAKSGYIRFNDESSAENFAKLSRDSTSFSARVLPASQQQAYWDKANEERRMKLSRKKNEKGSDKIARKVFERNKATFHQKSSHTVFNDNEDETVLKKEEKQADAVESSVPAVPAESSDKPTDAATVTVLKN